MGDLGRSKDRALHVIRELQFNSRGCEEPKTWMRLVHTVALYSPTTGDRADLPTSVLLFFAYAILLSHGFRRQHLPRKQRRPRR